MDTLGGHRIVVILPTGTLDLTQPDAGNQLVALLDTDHALSAALPVVTNLTGETPSRQDRRGCRGGGDWAVTG